MLRESCQSCVQGRQAARKAAIGKAELTSELLQIGVRQSLLDLQSILLTVQLLPKLGAPLLSTLLARPQLLGLHLLALVGQVPRAGAPLRPGVLGLLLDAAFNRQGQQYLYNREACVLCVLLLVVKMYMLTESSGCRRQVDRSMTCCGWRPQQ